MHATPVPFYRWRRPLMIAITILFMLLIFAQTARADSNSGLGRADSILEPSTLTLLAIGLLGLLSLNRWRH